MNRIFFTALLAALLTFTNASAQIFKRIQGNDKYITKDYKIADFTKLEVSDAFNVICKVDADSAGIIVAYGEENILDILSMESVKGKLTLKMKSMLNPTFGIVLIHLYTSAPLTEIKSKGGATIENRSEMKGSELKLSVNGGGQIKAPLIDCGVISAHCTGSGDILVAGKAGYGNYGVTGSGEVRAQDVTTQESKTVVTGSGDIKCNVSKDLSATITGSGTVFYRGKPNIKATTIGGQVVAIE